jgi:hypothetical protein
MFELEKIRLTKETWWHKAKRRLFARPVLSITKDGYYALIWYWKNGTCELVKHGINKPGGIVKVPAGCRVIQET